MHACQCCGSTIQVVVVAPLPQGLQELVRKHRAFTAVCCAISNSLCLLTILVEQGMGQSQPPDAAVRAILDLVQISETLRSAWTGASTPSTARADKLDLAQQAVVTGTISEP
jgi:hypothetical protein